MRRWAKIPLGVALLVAAYGFTPNVAFWQNQSRAIAVVGSLGASPSNSLALRSVTIGGPGITFYRAVVITSGNCTDPSVATSLSTAPITPASQVFNFTPPANTGFGTFTICAVGKNSAGAWQATNSPSSSSSIVIDTVAPAVTSLQINGGATTTTNNRVTIAVNASDADLNITHLCFKTNSVTPPSANDSCFGPISAFGGNPAKSLTLGSASYVLAMLDGNYTIYAWAKDAAGNVSTLASSGAGQTGVDKASIQYSAPQPPSLANVVALNSNNPTLTPALSDVNVTAGAPVYIYWRLTAPSGLSATPVSISYTTDNTNYTTISSSVSNGANSCSVDGTTYTGCYVWSNPGAPSGYFRIKVSAVDLAGLVATSTSNALNTGSLLVVAGNTSLGQGGDARLAMYESGIEGLAIGDWGNYQSFVVTRSGVIYFKDTLRGILKVDPTRGLQELFIPTTGTLTGLNGPASSATLALPRKIALDFNDRVLIYDFNKILRIESDGTLKLLVGGGASRTNGIAGTGFQLDDPGTVQGSTLFQPAPNGDIYFSDQSKASGVTMADFRLYKWNHSDGKVYNSSVYGNGVYGDGARDLSGYYLLDFGLDFDPTAKSLTDIRARLFKPVPGSRDVGFTSFHVQTGANLAANSSTPNPNTNHPWGATAYFYSPYGDLYNYDTITRRVDRYNRVSKTWTPVFAGGVGQCADGTSATSCLNNLYDFFVDANNQLYVLDGGAIRNITTGTVVTVVGQQRSSGNNGPPLAARFGKLEFIAESTSTNKIYISDDNGGYLWESTRSGTIKRIAGNSTRGHPTIGSTALTSTYGPQLWDVGTGILVDSSNDSILVNGWRPAGCHGLAKLNRSTGIWDGIGSATCGPDHWAADGRDDAKPNWLPHILVGFDGTNLMSFLMSHDWTAGRYYHFYLKLYSVATGVQQHFAGNSNYDPTGVFPADGTSMSTSNGSYWFGNHNSSGAYDSVNQRWLLATSGYGRIVSVPWSGGVAGTLSTYANLSTGLLSFIRRVESNGTVEAVYYCGTDGILRRKNVTANTETQLSWPSPSMRCTGKSMTYNPNLHTLAFPVVQDGLYGVATYAIGAP